MIHYVIDILKNSPAVTTYCLADNIFPIQRTQKSGRPCIVVDHTNVRTSETKNLSSDLDFHDLQVVVYETTPQQAWTIHDEIRKTLDNYRGEIDIRDCIEIRFDNMETGMIEEDQTFIVSAEYTLTVTRTALSPHS